MLAAYRDVLVEPGLALYIARYLFESLTRPYLYSAYTITTIPPLPLLLLYRRRYPRYRRYCYRPLQPFFLLSSPAPIAENSLFVPIDTKLVEETRPTSPTISPLPRCLGTIVLFDSPSGEQIVQ